MGKKRPRLEEDDAKKAEAPASLPAIRDSDEPPPKKRNWINKTRLLVFSSRGVTFRARHLLADLHNMMPHSKKDSKMDRKDQMSVIDEICGMKNCDKVAYLEMKKKQDLYLWLSNVVSCLLGHRI